MYGSEKFNSLYEYKGELGAIYSKNSTKFILWAPTATEVNLLLFNKNDGENEKILMNKGEKGTWVIEVDGDLNGQYYNYLVSVDSNVNEVVDPYAKAVGVNGLTSMVIDMESTNPEGWENDKKPKLDRVLDSILYEVHIRDFSIDENSGVKEEYRGKYKGIWQDKTKIPNTNTKTCLSHVKDLGVTTIHLMPTFDYCTVDESKLDVPQFNWGYDPQNYNVPEGSYSLDPFNGEVRIKEFKEMVMKLHEAGIRVVMDVVYNHTFASKDSNLNLAVPNYYYRQDGNGNFSNGSGCGNELASERVMVRRFIVDSIIHWAKEYHIDGFRFDLMGLEDIETMKQIRKSLDEIDENLILYGEGWTGGWSALPERDASLKHNTPKYGDIQLAMFNDNIRDGIKGHVFNTHEKGFVNDQEGFEETIKFGIVAATYHSQIKYHMVANSKEAWANEPYQTINYASAHDNYTLWDKLQLTTGDSNENLVAMNKLSAAIVLTSQGIPFIQSGEEFARTKVDSNGVLVENSYNSPDSVNKLDWKRKEEYSDLVEYYKGLIKMRKAHNAFRMEHNSEIQDNLTFLDTNYSNVIMYNINGEGVNDSWKNIVVIFNGRRHEVEIDLPGEEYIVVVNESKAGIDKLGEVHDYKVKVPAKSCYVLIDKKSFV